MNFKFRGAQIRAMAVHLTARWQPSFLPGFLHTMDADMMMEGACCAVACCSLFKAKVHSMIIKTAAYTTRPLYKQINANE